MFLRVAFLIPFVAGFLTPIVSEAQVTGKVVFYDEDNNELTLPLSRDDVRSDLLYRFEEQAAKEELGHHERRGEAAVAEEGRHLHYSVNITKRFKRVRFEVELDTESFYGREWRVFYTHNKSAIVDLAVRKGSNINQNERMAKAQALGLSNDPAKLRRAFGIYLELLRERPRQELHLSLADVMRKYGEAQKNIWPEEFSQLVQFIRLRKDFENYDDFEEYIIYRMVANALFQFDQSLPLGGDRQVYDHTVRIYKDMATLIELGRRDGGQQFEETLRALQEYVFLTCNPIGQPRDCISAFELTVRNEDEIDTFVFRDFLYRANQSLSLFSNIDPSAATLGDEHLTMIGRRPEAIEAWVDFSCALENNTQAIELMNELDDVDRVFYSSRKEAGIMLRGGDQCANNLSG